MNTRTPEPFPYDPEQWILIRCTELMAARDEHLIRQLCFNQRVDSLNVACADLVWELHCLKVAINHFDMVCTAWKGKNHGN